MLDVLVLHKVESSDWRGFSVELRAYRNRSFLHDDSLIRAIFFFFSYSALNDGPSTRRLNRKKGNDGPGGTESTLMVLTGARLLATAQAYHLSGGNLLTFHRWGLLLSHSSSEEFLFSILLSCGDAKLGQKKNKKKKKTHRPMVRERAHWDLITRDSLSNYLMTLMAGLKPAGDFWVRFPPKKIV